MLGMGNSAYLAGNVAEAERAFRAFLERHPDAADGWNNLAQLLLEQGDLHGAQSAIATAIALGGPRLGTYRQLQQQLLER
jgi:predicted Zn-dependent protease